MNKNIQYLVIGLAVGYLIKTRANGLGFNNPALNNNEHLRPETVTGNEELPWWNFLG